MYAAIRQFKAKPGSADALAEKIKEAISLISDVSGFMGSYVVYAPDEARNFGDDRCGSSFDRAPHARFGICNPRLTAGRARPRSSQADVRLKVSNSTSSPAP